jgi:TPP-dependent pyruvate/acetoin dehydrogenase alpha subunit
VISIEKKNKKISKEVQLSIEFYRKLYLIRASEEKIIKHYFEDEMKTPMHMSMGEEAIAVGICSALKDSDQVFGTYRSHAIYLTKTDQIEHFFAEMYGKGTSLQKGKAGSMHLCFPEHGFMGTSAIVGSVIPVAVGAAFANKTANNDKIAAVFFGDGAIDEGVFWESLNVACLMKLPILFICEDNGYAVHSPAAARHGYGRITDIVSRFNCTVMEETTTDTETIYDLANEAIRSVKTDQKPCFLYLNYYRYLEHVGVCEDFNAGYRSEGEFKEWKKKDPVLLQRQKLIRLGVTEDQIVKIEQNINKQIAESVENAQQATFADKETLYEEVL